MNASHSTVAAFERLSCDYDVRFTNSVIGRAQREVVWRAAEKLFRRDDHIVELNCGTGEDAVFLASRGMSVLALDATPGMVARARERVHRSGASSRVSVELLANEELGRLRGQMFDGVFSNFSGLNCVKDHREVAVNLSELIRPGGKALLCVSSRVCAFEAAWYVAQANFAEATRRWSGKTKVKFGSLEVEVWYPSVRQLQHAFAPWFRLLDVSAVGLFIPPSYAESWAARHPRTLTLLSYADHAMRRVPALRTLGDHVLLAFERCP